MQRGLYIVFLSIIFWAPMSAQSVLDTICINQPPSNLAVPYNANYYYKWNVGTGTILTKPDSNAIRVSWANARPGYLPIYSIAFDASSGCPGDTSWSSLFITNASNVQVQPEQEVCEGDIAFLESPLTSGFYWQNGSRKANLSFRAKRDTTLYLVALGGECGNDTIKFPFKVLRKPAASMSYVPDTVPLNTEHTIKYNGELYGGETIEWFLNGYSEGYGRVMNLSFKQHGLNELAQLIYNGNCADTLWKDIYVDDAFAMHFPNSFTPNGDGLNEYWNFSGIGYESYEAQVYDRWGSLIFSWASESGSPGWDGTVGGQQASQGAYVYVVTVKDYRGERKVFKDYLTLIR